MRILSLNSILPFGLKHTGYQPLQRVIVIPTDPIDGARTSIVAKATIDNGNVGIIENTPITGSATYNYKYNDYGVKSFNKVFGDKVSPLINVGLQSFHNNLQSNLIEKEFEYEKK